MDDDGWMALWIRSWFVSLSRVEWQVPLTGKPSASQLSGYGRKLALYQVDMEAAYVMAMPATWCSQAGGY